MGLLERLVMDGEKEDIADALKQESLPLLIWGCGNLAELVQKYLREIGVQEAGFLEWPTVYRRELRGVRVYSLEEAEARYRQYNVIVGHSRYSRTRELLESASNIKRVFHLFSFDYCGNNCNTYFKSEVVRENIQAYEKVYGRLGDQESRDSLAAFLNTKMTGKIEYIFDIFQKETSIFENDVYTLAEDECYWNIGGGRGETVAEFLQGTGNRFRQIAVLEPDADSYRSLCGYLDSLPFGKGIIRHRKAAWNRAEEIRFYHDCEVVQSGSVGNRGEESVEGIPLDGLLSGEGVLPPTLITANYFYGMEETLAGCRQILQSHAPKLAIVVGHNDECGILRATEGILRANPDYRLYLRFSCALATTLVLYAVIG